MKAIAIVPGQKGVRLVDRPEPELEAADSVKVRTVSVGICGTDREEAAGGRACAPSGAQELVIGHEMLGEVVATGREVGRVKQGDFAVFTVRRGCGRCLPCRMNRPDMCLTGGAMARGRPTRRSQRGSFRGLRSIVGAALYCRDCPGGMVR